MVKNVPLDKKKYIRYKEEEKKNTLQKIMFFNS